ncbi:MAG: nitroreductase family protein [Ruminococcus sp.]|nr:nitroreductase family protein [Ruminococcus sp.]
MNEIEKRRSIRRYKSDAVAWQTITEIVEAARLAPSAKNRQPWKFIVFTGKQKDRLLDTMNTGIENTEKALAQTGGDASGLPDAKNTLRIMRQAPVTIIVMNPGGNSPYEPADTDTRTTEICDTLSIGAAVQNLLLAAQEKGLGTLWIANTLYAYDELCEFIGEKGQLACAISLGYPDEDPNPRPRKPLEDILEFR